MTPRWREQGEDPDYRFTLANERTFLSWIRTALALLAGAVAIDQFAGGLAPRWVIVSLAVGLGVLAILLSGVAYSRWKANEIAMRRQSTMPHSPVLSILAGAALVIGVVFVAVILLRPVLMTG